MLAASHVIGTVTVDSEVLYRSPVMKEGMHGEKVSTARWCSIFVTPCTWKWPGIIEQVDFNQSDWANAEVELIDGRRIRLGDLPTAPLAEPLKPMFHFLYL